MSIWKNQISLSCSIFVDMKNPNFHFLKKISKFVHMGKQNLNFWGKNWNFFWIGKINFQFFRKNFKIFWENFENFEKNLKFLIKFWNFRKKFEYFAKNFKFSTGRTDARTHRQPDWSLEGVTCSHLPKKRISVFLPFAYSLIDFWQKS